MVNIQLPKIYPVTSHTDFVGAGTTFIAIPGSKVDGVSFIPLALAKGAQKIVIQKGVQLSEELLKCIADYQADIVEVENCREALARLSADALGNPAKKLKIIGVTGTKGKTSSVYMLYHLLQQLGKKVALSSTVEKIIDKNAVKIPLTTPLPDQLHIFLQECVQRGVEYVVLEVSAQALSLHRLAGIEFEAGIFTNFSMEHLEFYKNMQEYFQAKSLIVKHVKDKKHMFLNADDQYCALLKKENPLCATFSLKDKAATAYGWSCPQDGYVQLHMRQEGEMFLLRTPFLGRFNVYNALGVFGALRSLGFDLNYLAESMMSLRFVPGRMEQYKLKNNARCFIDYAHNPSSFEAVLSTLRGMTDHLVVVFGAGGCRDKQKRPMMGAISQKYCDIIVLTSDNPREEDPKDIIQDIERGFAVDASIVVHKELNRTKAIELSYQLSRRGSIIAVLGKGRDEYQIVGDLTFPFKERSIIKKFIEE